MYVLYAFVVCLRVWVSLVALVTCSVLVRGLVDITAHSLFMNMLVDC